MIQKSNIHFDISERKILLRLFDSLSVLFALYLIGLIFDFDYFKINAAHWLWSLVLIFYLQVFGTIFELYNLQKASKFDVIIQNIILTVSVTVLFYLLTPFYTPTLPENRLQIVYFYLAILISLFIWRYAYVVLISAPRFFKKVILIAKPEDVSNLVKDIQESDPNYKVVGFVNSDTESYEPLITSENNEFEKNNIEKIIKDLQISEIVVAVPSESGMTVALNNALISLLERGIVIREYSQVYEEITHRVPVHQVTKDFYRYFPFSRSNQNKLYLFFHRLGDILLSVIGLLFGILLSPIILIGNLCANRGPLFYTQERVGHNGRVFKIYKLRSMIVDAEKDGAAYASKKDRRITKFGNFLRRTRIDEIPQFFNILKGDMSIIGPRPERPVFVKELSQKIPFYEIRHIIKPGLTGWAQVNATYGSTTEDALEKLQYDLYYIKHRSFLLDASIIIKTLSTVIFFRGQ
jgi:exopolysaccharide biosynthesis polyprenyl glycosylphosphotransferase